ncbi:MAG: hypothetical protein E6Q66_04705 [Pedobacter sp.]|nr:MAG: hypothetical protein E6Q66_04705 [Pedobacter sp.]
MSIFEKITNYGLSYTDGEDNSSGIQQDTYFLPISWMKTISRPKAGTTAASLVEINESHVMNTGKGPVKMYSMFKKSGFKGALEGEELCKIFKQGPAEFFIPRLTADNLGTVTAIKNYQGIVLMRRAGEDNEFVQIGSEGMPAQVVNVEFDLGTGPTGSTGIKVTFEAYGKVPYYVYKGDIPSDKMPSSVQKSN